MAAIDFTQRTEFESYVFNAEHTVDVLVTLRAARSRSESDRAPVCVSAAIDRSGSMRGRKIDLVKRTLQFVVRQFSETDKLGFVTYDTEVEETMPMTVMTAEGRQKGDTKATQIQSGSMTNLSGGLFKSIEQIKDAFARDDDGNPGPVQAVILLTDGLATSGITDPDTLVHTLRETLKSGPPIKVHTFGYGSDHNAALLKKLSDIGDGNYYYIQADEDAPTSFADALGGLASVVVQNAVLEISSAQPGIRIDKVFTGMTKTYNREEGSYKIQTSDLYSEERKDIMVRLKIPALEAPVDADALLNVNLSYFDIPAAGNITTEAVVCVKRPAEVPENQVADEDFLDQRLRINVANALLGAVQMAEAGNYAGAREMVSSQLGRREMSSPSRYAIAARSELQDSLTVFDDGVSFSTGGNRLWALGKGHRVQRGSRLYRSSIQEETVSEALDFTTPQPEMRASHAAPASSQAIGDKRPPEDPPTTFACDTRKSKKKKDDDGTPHQK